jgi:2-polyprenyl-3-methyl-5-hydroxy-6-metoxy-1,4-benzoquinol methylase
MSWLPWRVRKVLSQHFPLLYHFAANWGRTGNSPGHWDARLAETWDAPVRQWPTKNELIASLTNPGEWILDIGCGDGGILRSLKARGYRNLHGLEISDYAVSRLRAEGIEMHSGMLPAATLPLAAFDVVIASQVLEHVIRRRRFLTEIRRLLKPGGRALFFVPDDCLGPIDESEHVVKFTARTFRKCLETRFRVVELRSMKDVNHPMSILFAQVVHKTENAAP